MNCLNCQKETNNPKFCCKSCSAIYNNSKNSKRKKRLWHCEKCHEVKPRPYYGAHQCDDCRNKIKEYKYLTLLELREMYKSKGWQRQNVYTYIREKARKILKKQKINGCFVCGYSKHVEICHKKPIGEYPDDTVILEINSIDNLVALCPNCHWEFDNGLIKF